MVCHINNFEDIEIFDIFGLMWKNGLQRKGENQNFYGFWTSDFCYVVCRLLWYLYCQKSELFWFTSSLGHFIGVLTANHLHTDPTIQPNNPATHHPNNYNEKTW